jgi:hypothetical protein
MPLEQASSKVERAKYHIHDLNRAWGQYASKPSHGLIVVQNAEGTQRTLRIVMDPPVPPEIAVILGDAVHNLRAALDLATWEIVSPLGPRSPKKVQFPFVESRDRFEDALAAREIKQADKKIVDAFRGLEPYPKGKGDLLWKLDALDIADKHKLLIPSIAVLSIDELMLREIDPSAHKVVIRGLTMIPNERGELPFGWLVNPKNDAPLKDNPVIKATFQMSFAEGQQFENKLCISRLTAIANDVEGALVTLRSAMV